MANSWRRERWDSLRLLTPNWQSRLPGHAYDGPDPDGYMSMPEVVEFISRFATASGAPVRTNTTVTSVTRTDDGYRVVTTDGEIRCRCVVLASGGYNKPHVPAVSASLPADVEQITPFDYRDPSQLADGGVLVATWYPESVAFSEVTVVCARTGAFDTAAKREMKAITSPIVM